MNWLRKKLSTVIFKYLVRQLESGHHEFVKDLSSCGQIAYGWKFPFRSLSLAINDAFWSIQEMLVQEHGYHRCPSCDWACRTPSDHGACVETEKCWEERREQQMREHDEQVKFYEEYTKKEEEEQQRARDEAWKAFEQGDRD